MCIGSKIRLNLPSWTGTASSVSIANGCGSSKFTLQDVPGYCEDKRFSSEADCSIPGVWVEESCSISIEGCIAPINGFCDNENYNYNSFACQNIAYAYCTQNSQRSINAFLHSPSKMWSKELILTTRARPLVRDTACTLIVAGLRTPLSNKLASAFAASQMFDLSQCTTNGLSGKKR